MLSNFVPLRRRGARGRHGGQGLQKAGGQASEKVSIRIGRSPLLSMSCDDF
jgi:hypothetical protein